MPNFFLEQNLPFEVVEEGKVKRIIKAHTKEMMMVEVFFENHAVGYQHQHPHLQTTYCLEGVFEFFVGEEVKQIQPGDSVCMQPNVEHGCKLLSTTGRLLDVFTPCREDFLSSALPDT